MAEILQNLPETLGWRVKLSTDTPVVSPGDDLSIRGEVTNLNTTTESIQAWTHVLLRNGSQYPLSSELVGPVTLSFDPGETKTVTLTHRVPSSAPSGKFVYRGFVGSYGTTIQSTSHVHFQIQ
jgi:hypothetical protein